MYDNIPNIINCIKTGLYSDMDFNKKIADENGINLEIALLAADDCCFNMTKKDIISRLLYKTDLATIKPEITEMLNSGIFLIKGRNLYINNGYNVSDVHEFFSDNSEGSVFFRYCLDYLTSWDACSLYYENDLCPSDIVESAYTIDLYVNKGKGSYKECAELMARNFNMKNLINLENPTTKRSKHSIRWANNRYYFKCEEHDFLRAHNYDFNLAQKKFGWTRLQKYEWKRYYSHLKDKVYVTIEDGNMKFFNLHDDADCYVFQEYKKNNRKIPDRLLKAIDMLDNKYPIIHGIPLLYPKERKILFLDILRTFIIDRKKLPSKEMDSLVKRTITLQNKFVKDLLDVESGNYVASLNINEHKEILQAELNEVYNKLLYMYVTDKENTVEFTDDWISNCLDSIDKSGLGKYKLYTDTLATMKNSALLLEPGKSFYDDQTWVEKLLIKTGAI